jgi:hypothetical protein
MAAPQHRVGADHSSVRRKNASHREPESIGIGRRLRIGSRPTTSACSVMDSEQRSLRRAAHPESSIDRRPMRGLRTQSPLPQAQTTRRRRRGLRVVQILDARSRIVACRPPELRVATGRDRVGRALDPFSGLRGRQGGAGGTIGRAKRQTRNRG